MGSARTHRRRYTHHTMDLGMLLVISVVLFAACQPAGRPTHTNHGATPVHLPACSDNKDIPDVYAWGHAGTGNDDTLVDWCGAQAIRWQHAFAGGPIGGNDFRVIGATIYVYIHQTVYALQASDGRVLWQLNLVTFDSVSLHPIRGALYATLRETASGTDTFVDRATIAIDAQTGRIRWKHAPPHGVPVADFVAADPDTGQVYIFEGDPLYRHGSMVVVQDTTGNVLWEDRPESGADIASGGRVYYATGSEAAGYFIVAMEHGHEIWRSPVPYTGLIYDVFSGLLMVGQDGGQTDGVLWLDANTGQRRAQVSYSFRREAAHFQTTYYALLFDQPEATAFDGASGKTLWTVPLDPKLVIDYATNTVRVAGGIVLLSTVNDIIALRASDGSQLWRVHTDSSVNTEAFCPRAALIDYQDAAGHWQWELLDAQRGTILWQQPGDRGNRVASSSMQLGGC